MKMIKFYRNSFSSDLYFFVSDEDYEFVSQFKWKLCRPDKSGNMYVARCGKQSERLHRLLLDVNDPKIRVDHKNMNTLDNTRENLRLCSPSENAANKRVQKNKKSSKYKGVFKRGKRFRVMIGFENKLIRLGTFDCEKEAAMVYNKKAKELFGEFALLNNLED